MPQTETAARDATRNGGNDYDSNNGAKVVSRRQKCNWLLRHPDGSQETHTLTGRVDDTLAKLLAAGADGLTTIEYPAPRTSDYIFKLRRRGFLIDTLTELHAGDFPGTHGRYILRSKVERLWGTAP